MMPSPVNVIVSSWCTDGKLYYQDRTKISPVFPLSAPAGRCKGCTSTQNFDFKNTVCKPPLHSIGSALADLLNPNPNYNLACKLDTVTVNRRVSGLLVLWTIRTLDYSYPGRFVWWKFHTSDISYDGLFSVHVNCVKVNKQCFALCSYRTFIYIWKKFYRCIALTVWGRTRSVHDHFGTDQHGADGIWHLAVLLPVIMCIDQT